MRFDLQKCNTFQKDVGLHLLLCHCSRSGLACGQLLGVTPNIKTLDRERRVLVKENKEQTGHWIKHAMEVRRRIRRY